MITTLTQVILLILGIIIVAYQVTKYATKDHPAFDDEPQYTQDELANIKAAESQYSQSLRDINPAPEFEVVEPEFVTKVIETAKVFPPDAAINVEEVKPVKKKRKYYPKKKK
jgi:hypothetical protein